MEIFGRKKIDEADKELDRTQAEIDAEDSRYGYDRDDD